MKHCRKSPSFTNHRYPQYILFYWNFVQTVHMFLIYSGGPIFTMKLSKKIPEYIPADSYLEVSNSLFRDIYTLFCGRQKCPSLYSFGPAVMKLSKKIPEYIPADSYLEVSNSLFRDIYTLFCGRQKCPSLYSFGPAVRECYLLHFCLDGCGDFYANDQHYHLEKGQGFLICPNELTFYQADEAHPWTYAWIGLSGERRFLCK